MIKLYGMVASRALRCFWALEEAALPYEPVDVDFAEGEHLGEAFRAVNPIGKVPALVDGDFVLTESVAICTYIADQVPEARLAPPPGTPQRAHYEQWMLFVATELEQPLWTIGKHAFALPREYRVRAMRKVAEFEWTRPAAVMAEYLENRDYLVGDRFTMADVCAAQTLFWARRFKVALGHDALDAYLQRHTARPAFQRVIARMPPPT